MNVYYGVVFILCLIGASAGQDEFNFDDSGSHQPMIPDDHDPLTADQSVFDPSKSELYSKEPKDGNAACSCSYYSRYCTCCAWIYVSRAYYYQYTCVKFWYYSSSKKFYTGVQIGHRSYYTGYIGLYRPVIRCTSVYMYYVGQSASFCVHLTNLKRTSYAVTGRVLISVYYHGWIYHYYCLGWFRVVKAAAEKTRLEDGRDGRDMIGAAQDSGPAAAEARPDVPPPGFRDNAVAVEIPVDEPPTAGGDGNKRRGVPPPGFLGSAVAMEIVAEAPKNIQMV